MRVNFTGCIRQQYVDEEKEVAVPREKSDSQPRVIERFGGNLPVGHNRRAKQKLQETAKQK